MTTLNKVFILGNLTKDVTMNKEVANTSLAINEKYKDKTKVHFVEVSAFGKIAEVLHNYCSKGSLVLIEGKLDYQTWQDKKEGKTRSALKVIAYNVQFLNSSKPKQEEEEEF